MSIDNVFEKLKAMGNSQTAAIFDRHGANGTSWGVKVADIKKLVKEVKSDKDLCIKLYESGCSDAMYLCGLALNGAVLDEKTLDAWVEKAPWYMISEYTIPWLASENKNGQALALRWIDSSIDHVVASGWSTLSAIVSIMPDEKLDKPMLLSLLHRAQKDIGTAGNRGRYAMNGFVISVGTYVGHLMHDALEVAQRLGKVEVDLGGTACKVPLAYEYIIKSTSGGTTVRKKKKTAKC